MKLISHNQKWHQTRSFVGYKFDWYELPRTAKSDRPNVTSLYSPSFLVLNGARRLFDSWTQLYGQHYKSSIITFRWSAVSKYSKAIRCLRNGRQDPATPAAKVTQISRFIWTSPTEEHRGVKITFQSYLTYNWITSHTQLMSVRISELKIALTF